jgi:hypothetical protein
MEHEIRTPLSAIIDMSRLTFKTELFRTAYLLRVSPSGKAIVAGAIRWGYCRYDVLVRK